MLVKIHESYRKIVAVCDAELLGKRFEQGKMQLDCRKDFYGGKLTREEEVIKILKQAILDAATFNLVGKKAVACGVRAGIISKEGIIKIAGIPYALGLL